MVQNQPAKTFDPPTHYRIKQQGQQATEHRSAYKQHSVHTTPGGQQATSHDAHLHDTGQQATSLGYDQPRQQATNKGGPTDTYLATGQQATKNNGASPQQPAAQITEATQGTSTATRQSPTDQGQLLTLPLMDSPSHSRRLPDFLRNVDYPTLPDDTAPTYQYYSHDDYDKLVDPPNADSAPHQGAAPLSHATRPFPSAVFPHSLAVAYETALEASRLNSPELRPLLKTSLVISQWEKHTTGHADDEWIMDSIKHGFPIQYGGPPRYDPLLLYNHSSANNHPQVIRQYLKKELREGAVFGPFSRPPFTPWMVISPLMTREKPDSAERRVIVDLSYPEGGVNKFITPHVFNGRPAVHDLPTVEHAVGAFNTLCPGDINLAVIDLSRAYRQFPVPPTDWPLLGIQFDGSYFCDGRLPFGARLSAFAMQSVARFIIRAMAHQGIKAFMYLDDILLISGSSDLAQRHY